MRNDFKGYNIVLKLESKNKDKSNSYHQKIVFLGINKVFFSAGGVWTGLKGSVRLHPKYNRKQLFQPMKINPSR